MGRCHPGGVTFQPKERELVLPGACGRNEEHPKHSEPQPGRAARAPGQEERALPVPIVRKELPTEGGIGEHTTCTQQPADEIFFVDVGWVVERRAFPKDRRQYLFLCK